MFKKIRGRERFNKFRRYIIILSQFYKLFPVKTRIAFFEYHRMTKGTRGLVLRYALIKSLADKCGDNVSIHPGVYLLRPDNLIVGNNVSIHPMCYIDATGGIEIGNDVSIAHGVTVLSTTHKYDSLEIPIKDQGIDLIKTKINNNVWIGAKATILAGIEIGCGSVVAANAVVTKSLAENIIAGGVPAKLIKIRSS